MVRTTHIDLGNCQFLYKDTTEEIKEKIEEVVNNDEVYENMKNVARNEGISQFSYLNIAKKSIDYKVDRKDFESIVMEEPNEFETYLFCSRRVSNSR